MSAAADVPAWTMLTVAGGASQSRAGTIGFCRGWWMNRSSAVPAHTRQRRSAWGIRDGDGQRSRQIGAKARQPDGAEQREAELHDDQEPASESETASVPGTAS